MKMKTMKKANILKKNIQRFGSLGIRLVLLNNLSHFWSQRNNVFYKNELNKTEYLHKYLTHIIRFSMITHINNLIKNTIDYTSINVNDNIAKKHSMKNLTENKLFLNKKYKKNLFKTDLNYNLTSNLVEIPNFIVELPALLTTSEEFSESIDVNLYSEKCKYCMYAEYMQTYNLIKNIFDNIKKQS